jgi:hypothetical protein
VTIVHGLGGSGQDASLPFSFSAIWASVQSMRHLPTTLDLKWKLWCSPSFERLFDFGGPCILGEITTWYHLPSVWAYALHFPPSTKDMAISLPSIAQRVCSLVIWNSNSGHWEKSPFELYVGGKPARTCWWIGNEGKRGLKDDSGVLHKQLGGWQWHFLNWGHRRRIVASWQSGTAGN